MALREPAAAPYRLRPGGPFDLDELARIESESFPAPWKREFFASELVEPHRYVRVLARDPAGPPPVGGDGGAPRIGGYLFAVSLYEEFHVNKIATDLRLRHQGYGRMLLEDALARARSMLILENEYDCEFHYAGTNHPPIFSHAPESTLLLNTFAKAVSPSLRLGFIVAPPVAAAALADLIERERVHVSWPVQKVVETLLVSGELDRHLRRVRRHYGAMRDAIRERLIPYADVITLGGDEGGLHVVVSGQSGAFDRELRAALRSNGVVFNDVRDFAMLGSPLSGFVLGYGHMDSEVLMRSLDVLEACLGRIKRCGHS